MADRYQNRSFPAGGDYDRDGGPHTSANTESDPLAELARLIGQSDPFGSRPISRANLPMQPQARPVDPEPSYDSYAEDPEPDEAPPPGPPSWMQRAVRQETPPPPPQDDYPAAVHPLHRYAAAHPAAEPEPEYESEQPFADPGHEPDLSRYDQALYGGFEPGAQHAQHDQGYADDSYGYEEDQGYDAPLEPRRRGGMITVGAVLALAVFGVGGAFAYRTYTGGARNGPPPIIRADAGPTKIIPASADATGKVPDRMVSGDGTEKIVSREEMPIDPSTRTGPRVVLPPLTPNGGVSLPTTVVPGAPTPGAANGTFSNNEPHKIRTLSVRGDQAEAGVPAGAAPPPIPTRPARTAATNSRPPVANANAPLSLAPQAESSAASEPPVRVATTNPNAVQIAPSAAAASGSYLVQISSQRSEADAQASFKSLQGKFPSVLGSRAPVIKRADLGSKGVYYRAMVGPFGSYEEASQFCGSLKSAGGQCVAQRN